MKYEPKYKIDTNDQTTQVICETYIKMKKENICIDTDKLYFRLKKEGVVVEDEDFLRTIIEYLRLIHVPGLSFYGYHLNGIPESAYDWKRQKMTQEEFQVFLCKITNLAIYFARKDIIPNISNKFILKWRYQYEAFTGYKLNKDKIGYMVKRLNEAEFTDITKNKQHADGKWSILHKIVLGRKHPCFCESILKSEELDEIHMKSRKGIITDFNRKEPFYEKWYGCWLMGHRMVTSMAEIL